MGGTDGCLGNRNTNHHIGTRSIEKKTQSVYGKVADRASAHVLVEASYFKRTHTLSVLENTEEWFVSVTYSHVHVMCMAQLVFG